VNGVLGIRPEDFGIKDTLLNYKYPVWLPRNEINQLVGILSEKCHDATVSKMYDNLTIKMEELAETLQKVETAAV